MVQDAVLHWRANGHRVALKRCKVEMEPIDAFAWLDARPEAEKVFWAGRSESDFVAGSGVAYRIYSEASVPPDRAFQEVLALLETSPDARFLGGLRFDAAAPDELWSAFGQYQFFLPRFEVVQENGRMFLICNLVLPRDQEALPELLESLRNMYFPTQLSTVAFGGLTRRTNEPKVREWRQKILWLLDMFAKGELHKVVLARKASFTFAESLNPILLLKLLKAQKPDCFHFLFQPQEDVCFISATPERLYSRSGATIFSEAVAGTRPRGKTPQEDADFGRALLSSEKDLREHAYVTQSIYAALEPCCEALEADEAPSLMQLTHRSHLYARVSGTLQSDICDADLLRMLHPTPAVGGHPSREAIAAISALEPFDRGWYAGPIGWIGADAAEFAVGIRSGVLERNTLSLFSGAGILTGSTPEGEWQEIEQKICDFLEVLGVDPDDH